MRIIFRRPKKIIWQSYVYYATDVKKTSDET